MTKEAITILAKESYINGSLNEGKVERFSMHMDRRDIKKYLRSLKAIETKHQVSLALADMKLYNQHKELFASLFPDKRITVTTDPTILLGFRITYEDVIYELSVGGMLSAMISEIEKHYE